MKKSSTGWRKQYSTDQVFIDVFEKLVSDLAANISLTGKTLHSLHDGIKKFRLTRNATALRNAMEDLPLAYNLHPYTFKVLYQLKNFLKRYVFEQDIYDSNTRKTMTVEKFLEVQKHIGSPHEYSYKTKLVLQRARQICKKVLGSIDKEELALSVRFGSKACVGFPTPRSYLHDKFAGPITGSSSHLAWLKLYADSDQILSDNLLYPNASKAKGKVNVKVVDTLNYQRVPKSYKIDRGMMPNTLAGTFKSRAIGKMIERRLRSVLNLDISRLPAVHRGLAKRESTRLKLVTADLSSASDTFTVQLMNHLLPRNWFNLVNEGRAKYVKIGADVYSLQSFMAMGIGFTFPLQTLLYYAIIKAIQELHGSYGTISVFGDDLIYPRGIHKFVVSVLNDCKFSLNVDKTFVSVKFRESCGGDFYHGIDVRPCQPEGRAGSLGKWDYVSLLHKLANGLTLRWSEEELPSTILFITKELAALAPIMIVPEDFPDYSGLKRVSVNRNYLLCAKTGFNKNNSLVFPCLLEQPKQKHVPTLIGYYWDKLRQMVEDDTFGIEQDIVIKGIFKRAVPRDLYGSVLDTIRWTSDPTSIRRMGVKPRFSRECRRTARRVALLEPSVADKQAKPILVVQQAISILAS